MNMIVSQPGRVLLAVLGGVFWFVGTGAARAAGEPEKTKPPELVELTAVEPGLRLDIRYATARNFIGRPVYTQARAFLQRPAAEALARVHRNLGAHGYGLWIFDAYRPWSVTKLFWDLTPPGKRAYVANPKRGSKHNRGCAVDLTLYSLATEEPVSMPSVYDEFSEKAHPDYRGGTIAQRRHRDLLGKAMGAEEFRVEPNEWWHFNYRGWRAYPIMDIAFEDVAFERLPVAQP